MYHDGDDLGGDRAVQIFLFISYRRLEGLFIVGDIAQGCMFACFTERMLRMDMNVVSVLKLLEAKGSIPFISTFFVTSLLI